MGRVARIYLPGAAPGVHRLAGEVAHRLGRVLRLREGDNVIVFAGDGREWAARVVRLERTAVTIEASELARIGTPPQLILDVRCALVRPNRFDWAVEKLTEAGADVIGALVTERTVERTGDGARLARWERIAIEASEQSGRLWVPAIVPPVPFHAVLEAAPGVVVFGHPAGLPFAEAARRLPETGRLTILVGPEGGFTEQELAMGEAHGALLASFGPHTLRSETAAVVAAALVRAHR